MLNFILREAWRPWLLRTCFIKSKMRQFRIFLVVVIMMWLEKVIVIRKNSLKHLTLQTACLMLALNGVVPIRLRKSFILFQFTRKKFAKTYLTASQFFLTILSVVLKRLTIRYFGPIIWNLIPEELKNITSWNISKKKLEDANLKTVHVEFVEITCIIWILLNYSNNQFGIRKHRQPYRGALVMGCSWGCRGLVGERPCGGLIAIEFAQQLCWDRASAWVFSCGFAVSFWGVFLREHLWMTASKCSFTHASLFLANC